MASQAARRGAGVLLSLIAGASVMVGAPSAGAATPKTIHPGVSVNYGDVTCTVGVVLRAGPRVFLGVPSSCGGIDLGKKGTDGCSSPQAPIGSPVSIEGAKHTGKLAYSSFSQMQLHSDTNPRRCYYNDLALVRVDPRDVSRVSAAIPGVGVPTKVAAKLPADGTALKIGTAAGTAGATHYKGWEVDMNSPTGMFKTPNCGSPVTMGRVLVGMLLVLPKGPIPMVPAGEAPAETFNLARSIHYLRQQPHFHRVHLAG